MKESFGERFTRLRKAKGLTQEDIARKVNISAQAVSKWENEVSSPDISILSELCDILGCSLDELLGRTTDTTVVLPQNQRKDINTMLLKIMVTSSNGDKVKVNLPLSIIKLAVDSGMALPQVNGKDVLKSIDLNQIFLMIDQGVIGKLVEVESSDGDIVNIYVE